MLRRRSDKLNISRYSTFMTSNNSQRWFITLGILVGIVFLGLGIVYSTRNAGSLPTWLPGYTAGSTHVHTKHAIAAFLLGIAGFILAWFQSGKKSSGTGTTPTETRP